MVWEQAKFRPNAWDQLHVSAKKDPNHVFELTPDQTQAVAAIMRVSTGHRRRPLVLISDRGRGRSTALGIAAARLIQQGVGSILVTAPGLDAIRSLMEPVAQLSASEFARIRFLPPDEITRLKPKADLVLVDEAAALPVPILSSLLTRYARIVFATTIHGYEGSGRGFSVRFKSHLEQKTPQWHEIKLNQPVRWGENDPVESFVFKALMLNAEPHVKIKNHLQSTGLVEKIDRDDLARDERLLSQIFGLLVLAHYQTRPGDLRNLLDGPGISIWVIRDQSALLAAALVAAEGGFDPETSNAIHEASRRPQGHLIPQSLSVHTGFRRSPELRYARVMRIAVHPKCERQGLGTRLLNAIEADAVNQDQDIVGASYGAAPGLMQFWIENGYQTVRLGNRRDAASGEYSVISLKPITEQGLSLHRQLRRRYSELIPLLLVDQFQWLDAALVQQLLIENQADELTEQDLSDLRAFIAGHRDYAGALVALRKLTLISASSDHLEELEQPELRALIGRVLQCRPWDEVAKESGCTGKAQLIQSLRGSADRMLSNQSG